MANWYDLNCGLLRIDAEDASLEEPLAVYVEELRIAKRAEAPAFTFEIARGAPATPPAGAKVLFEGPVPEAELCQLSDHAGSRWFYIPDQVSLEYSVAERKARIITAPGNDWLAGGTAAIHAIYAALYATGQALVHAAALRLPRRDEALILFAPSGAGKTTTALALALQGFGLLTDDAAVVRQTAEARNETLVWGLPRPPKIHQRTAEMLPAIGGLLNSKWNSEGEQSLAKDVLKSVIEFIPGRQFPLTALVLLGKRVTGPHRLTPMRKAELLIRFATDNVSRSPLGVMSDDLERFQRFVRLVAKTPAYELNVGSDLSTLGETIAAGLTADQAILSA